MRLIDADELQSKVADKLHLVLVSGEECYIKNNKTEIHYGLLATEISDVIEDMPTVERKSGNWIIKNTPPSGDGVFVCSECGSIDRDIGIPKFCRICGSKNSMKD